MFRAVFVVRVEIPYNEDRFTNAACLALATGAWRLNGCGRLAPLETRFGWGPSGGKGCTSECNVDVPWSGTPCVGVVEFGASKFKSMSCSPLAHTLAVWEFHGCLHRIPLELDVRSIVGFLSIIFVHA